MNKALELIPAMTHPLSSAWHQPDRSELLFDEHNDVVLMTEATLKKLPEYSCSMPSGVYEGKMWRSIDILVRNPANGRTVTLNPFNIDRKAIEAKGYTMTKIHYLHWWTSSDDPDKCKHNYMEIVLI